MLDTIKPYLPWLATSLLAFFLIFSNDNKQVEALRSSLSDILVIGTHPINSITKAPRIWNENIRLRARLSEMSLKLAEVGSSGEELKRMRRMLGFRDNFEYRLIAGEVAGMNPDVGVRGVLLNIGTEDGVELNQVVINPDGVVGRIYRVGKSSSAVQLLLDPNLGVAGRLKSNREDGIIHASGRRQLRLDGIPVNASVSLGDSVITSGLGGFFPSGLLIGYTTKAVHASDGWLWDIEVEPTVDFGRLDELFLIRKADSAK